MQRILTAIFFALTALPLAAQDNESFDVGGDTYRSGENIVISEPTRGDVFLAGRVMNLAGGNSGSAHILGQDITISGPVGENVYAAGRNITVSGSTAGNVTALGQTLTISGKVEGNLRAAAQTVSIDQVINGSAIIAGETIKLNAPVIGDAFLTSEAIVFGDGARVGGTLTITHPNAETVEVPNTVATEENIVRTVSADGKDWKDVGTEIVAPSFFSKTKGFFAGALGIAAIAAIFAALFPNFMAGAREAVLDRPLRTFWIGFLALSAIIGSVVMFSLTGIGLLLVPVSLLLILLLWFIGYVVGTYSLGVGLLQAIGRGVPKDLGDRVIAAVIGAIAAALLVLIPFVGWLIVLAIAWIGAGALIIRMFGPRLFVRAQNP